ncbi:5'-3' exoribonuclease 3 [Salvia divinorum]|uniref:5'-3' exoribonuclease n=1 Tax=Salvia divinorum TaxID=28513 RepID=A0ABD1GFM6_SALDI
MGVHKFCRRMANEYSKMVVDAIEEEPVETEGVKIPVDTSKPNPNNIEYHNLYLDMTGFLYSYLHPKDRQCPATREDVFQYIFDYIDRLFAIVRPRKLLYLAIDGVAPRAKMNQKRSWRFISAKWAAYSAAEEERLRQEFEKEGRKLPPKKDSHHFNTNITPGTPFMSDLSIALQHYIHLRLNNDPGWKDVMVILSDSNVPGEGKHKIMSYIRLQRNLPFYFPNTHHCLCGLDEDLIMLALATHEVHFSILSEVVLKTPGQQDKCSICGQVGHIAANCEGKAKRKAGEVNEKGDADIVPKKRYQFLNIWTLREYLELETRPIILPFPFDIEHIIDDFIFINFFIGNDFLPNMPTLEIHEGAINMHMSFYKCALPSLGGYLTDGSKPKLSRVERFIQFVGSLEYKIFERRAKFHGSRLASGRSSSPYQQKGSSSIVRHYQLGHATSSSTVLDIECKKSTTMGDGKSYNRAQKVARVDLGGSKGAAIVEAESDLESEIQDNKEELKLRLKKALREKTDAFIQENREKDNVRIVRLADPGWKERYYEQKFSAKSPEDLEAVLRDVVLKYIEGLCWVMHYYYEGVCSWQWKVYVLCFYFNVYLNEANNKFYPYHYAPFASDIKDLGRLNISFELGTPFKPFDQMLGVFPVASAIALPEQYRKLMTDPNSPIIDFYPADFEVDMNGKQFTRQGIAKLPFIEESRLLAEVAKIEHTLTEERARRNGTMSDMLFVSLSHDLSSSIFSQADSSKNLTDRVKFWVRDRLDAVASGGINGYISPWFGDPCPTVFESRFSWMDDIMNNQVICSIYRLPDAHKHIAKAVPGVTFPKKIVTTDDIKPDPYLPKNPERRQFDNQRHNHNTNAAISIQQYREAISIQQYREAAHLLLVNSLQQLTGHNVHAGQMQQIPTHLVGHIPHYQDYQNRSNPGGEHAVLQASSGDVSQAQNPHNRFQYPQNVVYNAPMPHARGYNMRGYYPHVPPQQFAPHPSSSGSRPSNLPGAYSHPPPGYSNAEAGPLIGSIYNHTTGSWEPPVNPNAGRGSSNPRQPGNQFSDLGRGRGRRPPQ